jgi:hypothetical protein
MTSRDGVQRSRESERGKSRRLTTALFVNRLPLPPPSSIFSSEDEARHGKEK